MRLIDADPIVETLKEARKKADSPQRDLDLLILQEMIQFAPTIAPLPNAPLTLEELREMDGEPVWCQSEHRPEGAGWYLVHAAAKTQINGAYDAASNAMSVAADASSVASGAASKVSGWTYPGSTYIDGSMLMTGTVKATSLQGGSVSLLDAYGGLSGNITLGSSSSSAYAVDIMSYAAMRLTANAGDLYLQNYNHYLWINAAEIAVNAPFVSRNVSSLGTSVFKWSDVYANNATIQTSDLTLKKDVRYGLDDYDALFDALKPMSFVFTDGESGRRHLGMGAQDIERAMETCGVSDMDFAGFIKSERPDGAGYDYALRYGEFIPLCIEQIQRLKARVSELERRTA